MKGYIIGRANIVDQQKSENYKPLAAAANKKFGGKYLARGGRFATKEGIEYERNVIIEFPSFDQANEFYQSEEYQEAHSILKGHAERQFQIVEGV